MGVSGMGVELHGGGGRLIAHHVQIHKHIIRSDTLLSKLYRHLQFLTVGCKISPVVDVVRTRVCARVP